MNANAFQELDRMKQRWQAQSATGPDLAALQDRVAAENRGQRRTVVVVGSLTLLVLAATGIRALLGDGPNAWFGFVFTAAFATLVWLVALLLSRGTWRPRDGSTAAYLEVSIRRCKSVIVAAPIGVVLYIAGLTGSLVSKQRLLGLDWGDMLGAPSMIIAGWIGAPLYTFSMLWNARRERKRLALLQDLKQQLGEN